MNRRIKVVSALVAVGLVVGGAFALRRGHAFPPVTVTLRVSVTPPEQLGFVAGQLSSARFKYLAGKRAGIRPELAQKLSVKLPASPPLLEAEVRVPTKDEAQKYVEGFVETLQMVCGSQAQVALAGQSIH